MKQITLDKAKTLEIEVDDTGFVLWITEENGDKHWLIDGSTVKEGGHILISTRDFRHSESRHSIIIDKNKNLNIVQPTK